MNKKRHFQKVQRGELQLSPAASVVSRMCASPGHLFSTSSHAERPGAVWKPGSFLPFMWVAAVLFLMGWLLHAGQDRANNTIAFDRTNITSATLVEAPEYLTGIPDVGFLKTCADCVHPKTAPKCRVGIILTRSVWITRHRMFNCQWLALDRV